MTVTGVSDLPAMVFGSLKMVKALMTVLPFPVEVGATHGPFLANQLVGNGLDAERAVSQVRPDDSLVDLTNRLPLDGTIKA